MFATAGITNDCRTIIKRVTQQINNQKIPGKSNLTPNELIRAHPSLVKQINKEYVRKEILMLPIHGLRELEVGDNVRLLNLDRKEQEKGFKQFAPKWTKTIFKVLKITRIRSNRSFKRYYLNNKSTFYRWELLWIPKKIDRQVPKL